MLLDIKRNQEYQTWMTSQKNEFMVQINDIKIDIRTILSIYLDKNYVIVLLYSWGLPIKIDCELESIALIQFKKLNAELNEFREKVYIKFSKNTLLDRLEGMRMSEGITEANNQRNDFLKRKEESIQHEKSS